jgi:NDP-sugar pyrophosphorylase family protein
MKYASNLDKTPAPEVLATLDHFPGWVERPLFASYAGWFAALQDWMPRAFTRDRVGVREVRPGIWMGVQARVSPAAKLQAPCWLGAHVYVGPGAVLGPHTIIEDRVFIEPETKIASSYVGADTFVGRFAQITDSVAWGETLINWQTGSSLSVRDSFLLCALRRPSKVSSAGWRAWLTEFFAHNKEEVDLLWKQLSFIRKDGA